MITNAETRPKLPNAPSRDVTLRDGCRILFRHKKKLLATFFTVLSIAGAIIVFWPRTYASQATLFVRVGRESVSLDPTATTGEVIPVDASREVEINSVLEMLRSKAILEKVVDTLGPEEILNPQVGHQEPASESESGWVGWLVGMRWIPRLDPIGEHEAAVMRLDSQLNIWSEENSNIIAVRCKAETPELAQRVVGAMVDIYLGEHVRLNSTPRGHAFFAEQAKHLSEKFVKASEALCDAKNIIGLVSIESQRTILANETIAVETSLAETQAALSAAQGRVKKLREGIATLPERIVTDEVTGHDNVAADTMRQQLYELQIRKAELASKLTDVHPVMIAMRQQIEEASAIVDQQPPNRTQCTTTVNTIREQLHENLLTEESTVSSLKAKAGIIETQRVALQARSRRLNEHEVQIAQLEHDKAVCETNCVAVSEKLEQSRIDAALRSECITNVNVVQAANYAARPTNPNKRAVALLGLLAAIFSGVGVALVAEYLDTSLKTSNEVEEILDLPVLTSIPKVSRNPVAVK